MTAQDPIVDYAVWNAPGSSFSVVYSIPLFHEIDFAVNEGYRRIPHGGLEIGGLLFGRFDADSVHVEAYRPIECEHSLGPSFVLSPRDVDCLREQLEKVGSDEELQGLVPVGWFISHSRGELLVSDREASLFEQFFPRPDQITVLIKPIKFQPTRFAFLKRNSDGLLARDGTQQAIILPLPGRAGRATLAEPTPSIAAPSLPLEEPAAPPNQPEPQAAPDPVVVETPEQTPEPEPHPAPVAKKWREPVAAPIPSVPPLPAPVVPEGRPQSKTAAPAMPHAVLTGTTPMRRSTDFNPPPARSQNRSVSILVSVFILLFAAGLGFAVGYLAYSRLSFSPISLTVEDHPPVLFVSWPPEESRDADSASIRIDDGPSRPLTLEEKAGGQAEIKMTGASVKVEVVTHSWFHESRGIVRYVRPPATPSGTSPIASVDDSASGAP